MNLAAVTSSVLATTAVVGSTALAVAQDAPATPSVAPEALVLHLTDSAPVAVDDGGRRGPSAGDELFFRANLDEGGALIATASMVNRRAGQFTATFRIPGRGSVTAQGVLDFRRAEQGRLAITGGTRGFMGADGAIGVRSTQGERIAFILVLR